MAYLLGSLIGLLILVALHELGHFVAARAVGVRTLAFSIGFGPKLLSWKDKSGCEYKLSAFPLGGYVKLLDADDEEAVELAAKQPGAGIPMQEASYWRRAAIILAGPAMNLVLGWLLMVALALPSTISLRPLIADVAQESIAAQAGLAAGDEIVAIDGKPVSLAGDAFRLLHGAFGADEIVLEVVRNQGVAITVTLDTSNVPFSRDATLQERYGITLHTLTTVPSEEYLVYHGGGLSAFAEGTRQSIALMEMMVTTIGRLVSGDIPTDAIGGPATIVDVMGKAVSVSISAYLFILAALSFNLAIVNMLPLPALDGGQFIMHTITAIRGKPAPPAVEKGLYYIGIGGILMLLAIGVISDIKHYLF